VRQVLKNDFKEMVQCLSEEKVNFLLVGGFPLGRTAPLNDHANRLLRLGKSRGRSGPAASACHAMTRKRR
jgi:hypothetical protein